MPVLSRSSGPLTRYAVALTLLALALALPAAAVDTSDTRMLTQPAVSADHVAFVYAGDLWVADRDGGDARRLTTHPGDESSPRFSPDGRHIAFSGHYDGNVDVFLIPTAGGVPERLTWHPGDDLVRDFTPDGSAVLFASQRHSHTRRYLQLFTVALDGGMPQQLPVPNAYHAAFSPDGRHLAYTPLPEAFRQWKHYRGGRVSRIWLYDRADHSVVEIPQPEGRSNDTEPMWVGDTVYFLSDRSEESAGELNLFAYDTATRAVRQLTFHRDFPVLHAAGGGGTVVYEQAGYLHLFDPASGDSERLRIGVAADLREVRPRWVDGGEFVRDAALSPTGVRVAFGLRGEIVTVPAEHGDPRHLTTSPGVHDRHPAWSPDGSRVAWFSDGDGEYSLTLAPHDGDGEVRRLPLDGAGFYFDPRWSPDSTKISFVDNSWTLYWIDVESGEITEVSQEVVYGPQRTLHHAWSPDSRWIAYTRNTPTYYQEVHLHSLDEGRSWRVTDELADVSEPVFDASGKYLWFFSSTDAGPVRQWFAQSNADMEITRSLYLAVLPAGLESPLAPRSDEETPGETEGDDGDEGDDDGEDDPQAVPRVEIDPEDLDRRIVSLPAGAGTFHSLQAGTAGKVYFLETPLLPVGQGSGPSAGSILHRFDLEEREETTLAEGVSSYQLSADGERMLLHRGESWTVAPAGEPGSADADQLALDRVRLKIDPRREWPQILDEAWRINRDYFYDPGMHGADWPAVRERYATFLPHLATRADLSRVIRWMLSELAVGHSYQRQGDRLAEPETVPGGLLGADYEVADGRYRFARVYGGLNWNPGLRAPLTEPGVEVEAGEYLLAVDGEELTPPTNLYSRFENTAGRVVELTVGPDPDGSGSRTVEVVPLEEESQLRNRAWVEGNLRRVQEATDGRVAYVYVPNTAGLGHTYFKRYFFPQAHKDAVIVDERHNGGGQVADYYIDLLRRPHVSYWTTRYGAVLKTPLAAIQGPKVMIIDETAGSGGDLLPWMFRELDLGTLVGKRTWGGLVGILGFPVLMDGGSVTAPNLAFWTADEGYIVENEGVPPDVEVEQWPAEVIAGRDPQLEKAIEVVLEKLEATPPREVAPPPFPVRVQR